MIADSRSRLERALIDPSAVYPNPEAVLDDRSLSDDEKGQILRRWEFDVAELAVATEEGMPQGDQENLTRRILLALEELDPEAPSTRSGPSKHHVSGGA